MLRLPLDTMCLPAPCHIRFRGTSNGARPDVTAPAA
jgi:hypothetical protein